MKQLDMVGVLAIVETAYPNIKRTEDQRLEAAKLWASLFEDDDPQDVMQAVRAYIVGDTTGFPPSIGQIKSRISAMHKPQLMSEVEAWGLVSRACRNGYYGAEEEFAKLPPTIQRVIGSPRQLHDWALLDEDVLESVIGSNFQRAYRVMEMREAEQAALPANDRGLLTDGF